MLDAVRDVYVRLLDEDPKTKQPGACGKTAKDNVPIPGCSPTVERA